jgi:chemotaxis protein MotB
VPIGEPYQPEREWPELQRPAPVVEPEPKAEPATQAEPEPADAELIARYRAEVQALIAQTRDDAAALAQQSAGEIGRGEVEVEARARTIVLRIRDGAAFTAATAELQPACRQLLRRLRDTLATRGGAITVGGHTEDAPAAATHLRSAWELSAARAAAVAQELLAEGKVDPRRLTVSGHAGTRPLAANDSPAHRARNSRVEIVIEQGFDAGARERLDALKAGDRAFWDALQLQDEAAPSPGGVN